MSKDTNILTQAREGKPIEYIGRVAKDKEPESKIIDVFIKDLSPFYHGKLEPKQQKLKVGGGKWQGEATLVNTVKAEWRGDNTNRRFPPDVKVNEQVKVYIHADQDKIYWDSLGRDDNLRRTEVVELTAADTPDGPEAVTNENSYFVRCDTRDTQSILIQTNTTGGEKHAYQIKIDAKNSRLTINDDADNEIFIETLVPKIVLRNRDETYIELAKKNITMIAPEDIMIRAGRQVVWDTPLFTVKNTSSPGVTEWNSGELAINADSVVITAKCIGLKGYVEADNIVAGPIYATLMGIINEGEEKTYKEAKSNVPNGTAKKGDNTPNPDGNFDPNSSQAVKHDQLEKSMEHIKNDLVKIDKILGYENETDEMMDDFMHSMAGRSYVAPGRG